MMQAQRQALGDGRWHLQHGPIDLVIGADGDSDALAAAHEATWQRFQPLLAELAAELPTLRAPVRGPCPLQGGVARRMWWACRPYHSAFITPMAAVAGAVAQELIGGYEREGITRAWVNNGGDIALHLAPGAAVRVGVFTDLARFDAHAAASAARGALPLDANVEIHAALPVRGIATSGWRGRSFSLGIADSVTILAPTASAADAAATIVANAVDVDAPGIVRAPASALRDDSDLGDRLVTRAVPRLSPALVATALARGAAEARAQARAGRICAAVLSLQGSWQVVGELAGLAAPVAVHEEELSC
jgi:ApbE superfamily uncharacterized protein (UPF0280 family)